MGPAAADLTAHQVRAMLKGESPSKPADFTGKVLCDLDLSGFDSRNADLRRTSFFGGKLVRAHFRDATLEGATLRTVNLFRVKLGGADLASADIAGADFTEADLSGAIFRGVQGYTEAKGLDHVENVDKIVR